MRRTEIIYEHTSEEYQSIIDYLRERDFKLIRFYIYEERSNKERVGRIEPDTHDRFGYPKIFADAHSRLEDVLDEYIAQQLNED